MDWHATCKLQSMVFFLKGASMTLGKKLKIFSASALGLAMLTSVPVYAQDIKIGLVAALTGPSAQSGESITRGLTVAIDEINAKGGVLGKKLVLIRRDDESSPPKGVDLQRESGRIFWRYRYTGLIGYCAHC